MTNPAGEGAPARPIWLCADDYAMSPGVSEAIRELAAEGRINATSVMVVSPSFDQGEAAALSRLQDGSRRLALGLHLTLTAPFRPLTGIAPLGGDTFPPLSALIRGAFLRRLDPRALRDEIAAQLAAFAAAFGRPPDFVDGHQHVHLLPQVRSTVLAAVPAAAPQAWVRQCGSSRWQRADRKALGIHVLSLGFARRARAAGLATNTAFAGAYDFHPDADFSALFPRFIDGMPADGLVMCHPGRVDDELVRLDPLTTLREHEHRYLLGAAFPRVLARHNVTLA